MTTNGSVLLRASERLVEFYTAVEALIDLTAPPANVLTDAQQLSLYAEIVANPEVAALAAKILGPTWDDFSQRMSEKASLLGLSETGLAPEMDEDDREQILESASSVLNATSPAQTNQGE